MLLHTSLQWLRQNIHQFRPTKDTPYLALAGKIWGVICEDFGEKWPRYKGTALYMENCFSLWYPTVHCSEGKEHKFFSAARYNRIYPKDKIYRVDSRLVPSQWEMSLQSNAVSHWLGINLESDLIHLKWFLDSNRISFLTAVNPVKHIVTGSSYPLVLP